MRVLVAGAGSQRWACCIHQAHVTKQFGTRATGSIPQSSPRLQLGTLAPRGSRNLIYAPGFQSWNAALQKGFHVIPGHENHVLTFRAEAFNFTNHPNWDTPSNDGAMSNPTSGTFGQVTTKGQTYASDRQLQFSLRYAF